MKKGESFKTFRLW